MASLPRAPLFDASLALRRDPYRFVSRQARRLGSDAFATRLLLRETICLTGPEAAELFYDPQRFQRDGAAPAALQKTLLGRGGVQTLDDEAHRHRKRMFLAIVTPERVARLADGVAEQWRKAAAGWRSQPRTELYGALHEPMTRAVCAWAGVPLAEGEVARRTRELVALFDRAGSPWGHWASRAARAGSERWAASVVAAVREGPLRPGEDTAAALVARHRERDGAPLALRTAAVELLNVLRPVVAVSVYVVLVAHALHAHPEWREKLASAPGSEVEAFLQEVRRFYPFFPAVPGRVRADFEWRGFAFRRGTRALLDLHGTDRDPRAWQEPDAFRPERFRGRVPSPFAFVPQGGGDPQRHHRCPGEGVTLAILERAVRLLARELDYRVPEQDLTLDWARLPALPRSRFVIAGVRERQGPAPL
jgi:fatty-acid peroxygenase